jgi:hypothetical protein
MLKNLDDGHIDPLRIERGNEFLAFPQYVPPILPADILLL